MMRFLKLHLPLVALSVMLAYGSLAVLAQTHILSSLFGAAAVPWAADIAFFAFAALYAALLWQGRRLCSAAVFCLCLWAAFALCAAALLF